ncbi:hypothetical protein C9374_000282 [Naegleria lovaniensis]|uniref:Uncharacterized protein n=1 Tax=Naegleria lovaniensis TaxID=51637 RepID=A0AA88H068_NAELO|nr:uncharacterized protein C9374_000282 [Naegleria lovaniensis]KAG2388843.1 hypothetical protein C9374_000282 [Naegleria lovaniensis]
MMVLQHAYFKLPCCRNAANIIYKTNEAAFGLVLLSLDRICSFGTSVASNIKERTVPQQQQKKESTKLHCSCKSSSPTAAITQLQLKSFHSLLYHLRLIQILDHNYRTTYMPSPNMSLKSFLWLMCGGWLYMCLVTQHMCAFCFKMPSNILSSYTTVNNTGSIHVKHHKVVGSFVYFAGYFKESINLSPTISLFHPKDVRDDCNVFIAKMSLFSNTIIWYQTEALQACDPYFYSMETSQELEHGDCDYVAIAFNTGYPCCNFIKFGGPGFILYNATNGLKLRSEQLIVYLGAITSLGFDKSGFYVGGHVLEGNFFGVEGFTDERSGGRIYNTFVRKYSLPSLKPEWLIQSVDTSNTANTTPLSRQVTGIVPVKMNGQNVVVVAGSFSSLDSTTWRDFSRQLVHVKKRDGLYGNYLLFVHENGTIWTHFSTRVSSFFVKREQSIVLCGVNSGMAECEEISLPYIGIKNVMNSKQFSSDCTSTIYSVTGNEHQIFIAAQFDASCKQYQGMIIQSLDSRLRDASWKINVTASQLDFISLSANHENISVSFLYNETLTDILGTNYYYPKMNLLMQLFAVNSSTSCFGVQYTDSKVCSSHGVCYSADYCICDYGYMNEDCSQFTCFGNVNNGCHNGSCVGVDTCECDEGFLGPHCNLTSCFGILSTDPSTCSGKGNCVKFDTCQCKEGYVGEQCDSFSCHLIPSWKTTQVCSGRGQCIAMDTCQCHENYFGPLCEHTRCFGIDSNNITVCGRYGLCTSYNHCECPEDRYGQDCSIHSCYSKLSTDPTVCNGNGTCVSDDNCVCHKFNNSLPKFVGDACEHTVCFGKIGNEACSGNGICIGPDECQCKIGFSGEVCNVNDGLLVQILVPIGGVIAFLVCVSLSSLTCYLYKINYWNKRTKTEKEMEQKLLEMELELENERSQNVSYLIPVEELELVEKIGSGGFGHVFKARWKQVLVAVKCVDSKNSNRSEEESFEHDSNEDDTFEKEVLLLNSLKHPNVIQFFGVCMTERKKLMVMEYLGGGSLDKLVYELKIKKRRISLRNKLQILFGVANGLCYLHDLKPNAIIHRDLKSGNILLEENLQPKVCDFGLSKLVGNNNNISNSLTTNMGTLFYMAEVIGGDNSNMTITNKIDVYSFGIVMYELFFEDNPFINYHSQKIHKFSQPDISDHNVYSIPLKVSKGLRPKIPFSNREEQVLWIQEYMKEDEKSFGMSELCWLVDRFMELMKSCWDQNPSRRPSFDDVADRLANLLSKCNV